jgi:hypothetical protein
MVPAFGWSVVSSQWSVGPESDSCFFVSFIRVYSWIAFISAEPE